MAGLLTDFKITYEPRGQGRSNQPLEKEAYSSPHFAEDFQAVCETFGAKKAVHVGWCVTTLQILTLGHHRTKVNAYHDLY